MPCLASLIISYSLSSFWSYTTSLIFLVFSYDANIKTKFKSFFQKRNEESDKHKMAIVLIDMLEVVNRDILVLDEPESR